jgi:hypothetical protein
MASNEPEDDADGVVVIPVEGAPFSLYCEILYDRQTGEILKVREITPLSEETR